MDLSALEAGLAARGVRVLRDGWTPLARGGEEIALLGLDDPGFAAGEDWTLAEGLDQTQARLSALLAQAGDRFSLVLSHRPELLPAYAEAGADLVLSGHAHGGQVRLPGIGGLFGAGAGDSAPADQRRARARGDAPCRQPRAWQQRLPLARVQPAGDRDRHPARGRGRGGIARAQRKDSGKAIGEEAQLALTKPVPFGYSGTQ